MTTIVAVKRGNKVAIAGDGRLTSNGEIFAEDMDKLIELYPNIYIGSAGSVTQFRAFIHFIKELVDAERGKYDKRETEDILEEALNKYSIDVCLDKNKLLTEDVNTVFISKNGIMFLGHKKAVFRMKDYMAVGSGSSIAKGAAIAMLDSTDLEADEIAIKAVEYASRIDISTNSNITCKTIEIKSEEQEEDIKIGKKPKLAMQTKG